MKNFIFFTLCLFLISSDAFAAANDWRFMRRDPTNIGNINFDVPTPVQHTFMVLDITSGVATPKFVYFGNGIQYSGGTINITGLNISDVEYLQASLDLKLDISAAFTGDYDELYDVPNFATVATSGSYEDLGDKPDLFSGDYDDLDDVPTTFTPSAHTHAAGDIVSGVLAQARVPSLPISHISGLQSALDLKFNIPSGTSSEYVKGDGSLGTTPVVPTDVSAFVNDSGYITTSALSGYLTSATAASTYVPKTLTVNGHALSGNIDVTKSDVDLGNVDNTSDVNKPVSSATQTALDGKVPTTRTVNGNALSSDVNITTISGNAGTATALAANGTNCSVGQYARGVDASGNAENCTALPSISRTFNSPSRTLNSCFQISSTNDADFHYGVDSGAVLALGTLTAAVTSYTNSGCTTGAITENDGTISGLSIGQGATLQLNGTIAAGRYVKITGAVTGLGNSASIRAAQREVILP